MIDAIIWVLKKLEIRLLNDNIDFVGKKSSKIKVIFSITSKIKKPIKISFMKRPWQMKQLADVLQQLQKKMVK